MKAGSRGKRKSHFWIYLCRIIFLIP